MRTIERDLKRTAAGDPFLHSLLTSKKLLHARNEADAVEFCKAWDTATSGKQWSDSAAFDQEA